MQITIQRMQLQLSLSWKRDSLNVDKLQYIWHLPWSKETSCKKIIPYNQRLQDTIVVSETKRFWRCCSIWKVVLKLWGNQERHRRYDWIEKGKARNH